MQLVFEVDDKIAYEFFNLVPENQRSFYLGQLLASHLSFKHQVENMDIKKVKERQLPFKVLPARGGMATNETINKIREEEGI